MCNERLDGHSTITWVGELVRSEVFEQFLGIPLFAQWETDDQD